MNTISEICFDISEELDGDGWEEVEAILREEKFTALQTVQVWPQSNFRLFPKLDEQGILDLYQDHNSGIL